MMNQPSQEPAPFYSYQNTMNRPSTANRETHDTLGRASPSTSMFGRQTLSRHQQPPSLGPNHGGQSSPNMYSTINDRSMGYDQFTPAGNYGNYATVNHNAWNYNAASLNGLPPGFGDGPRSRGGNRRAAMPMTWGAPEQPNSDPHGLPQNGHYPTSYQQAPGGFGNGHYAPHGGVDSMQGNGYLGADLRSHDRGDDLIPTAIVIKNIPFNVRKETLEMMMDELGLPKPYAFNYHFDKQVFRGLAFANFQSAEDTKTVIQQLNGFEVHGRKLRVEYKKMLPEHERDRIEREKRQKRGQLQEQHQAIPLQHHASMQSLTNGSGLTNGHDVPQARSSPIPADLNFNDPEILRFYTKLAVFQQSGDEILVFPGDTTPEQRRTIHSLAHHMGLEHSSYGTGDQRQVRVFKKGSLGQSADQSRGYSSQLQSQLESTSDASKRLLNRAATIDFGESRVAAANGYATVGRHGQPTLELPDSSYQRFNTAQQMRGVKSHADLRFDARTLTPSPSPLQSGYGQHQKPSSHFDGGVYGNHTGMADAFNSTSALTTPSTPGGPLTNAAFGASETSLTSGMSQLGLGSTVESSRPRENPGAIGSQRPSMSQLRSVPERNPRNPDWESTGFNASARDRTNGHRTRGSGSSNQATQESYTDLLSGSQSDKRPNNSTTGTYQH